jgi:hypothetical protein
VFNNISWLISAWIASGGGSPGGVVWPFTTITARNKRYSKQLRDTILTSLHEIQQPLFMCSEQ